MLLLDIYSVHMSAVGRVGLDQGRRWDRWGRHGLTSSRVEVEVILLNSKSIFGLKSKCPILRVKSFVKFLESNFKMLSPSGEVEIRI